MSVSPVPRRINWLMAALGTGGKFTDRARGRPKGPHPAPPRSRPYGYERHFATSAALETSCAVVRRLQRVD